MNFTVQQAIRKWDAEVDRETVRLIEAGVPPFDAVEQARKIVERRREAAAAQPGDTGGEHG